MEISRSISVCVGKDLEMVRPHPTALNEINYTGWKAGLEMHSQSEWQSFSALVTTNYTEQSNTEHSNW
jgi:hypothetical protein